MPNHFGETPQPTTHATRSITVLVANDVAGMIIWSSYNVNGLIFTKLLFMLSNVMRMSGRCTQPKPAGPAASMTTSRLGQEENRKENHTKALDSRNVSRRNC